MVEKKSRKPTASLKPVILGRESKINLINFNCSSEMSI